MDEKAFNQVFSKRLKHFLALNSMSQKDLANTLNVGVSTVSNWCTALKTPRADKIDAMCKLFNCNRSDLLQDSSSSTHKSSTKINVLGRVAAGIPINAIEEIIDTEEISEQLAKTGDFFGLLIKGDSMEPRICEGDVVIVRQQPNAESGDIVIALVNGDDATCKRLRKYRDGIELISLNPSYEPMFFSEKDIINKPVRIIGKVVELRGKF